MAIEILFFSIYYEILMFSKAVKNESIHHHHYYYYF